MRVGYLGGAGGGWCIGGVCYCIWGVGAQGWGVWGVGGDVHVFGGREGIRVVLMGHSLLFIAIKICFLQNLSVSVWEGEAAQGALGNGTQRCNSPTEPQIRAGEP